MTSLELETDEADRLAHELSALTGESVRAAVTKPQKDDAGYRARLKAHAARLRQNYDLSGPVTKAEWDEACGDFG
jgi:antitoxin VapB